MKLSLEHIDARTLHLDLGRDERVVVAEAQGLRGALQSADGTTTLSDVAAERIALAALRVLLGELVLSSETGAALTGVRASMTLAEAMTLATQADALDARDITVAIGDVHLHGAAKLTGVQLSVRGSEGRLTALRAELAGFTLRIGAVELATPALMGDTVVIAWGGDSGFRLTADALAAPALQVSLDGVSFDASDVTASAFALVDGRITVERAGVREGNVAIAFASSDGAATGDDSAGSPPPPTDEPWVELGTLDALSGDVDVDVDVDITVPIIGSRKATHRFRVPVEQGTIDFMALERNLSTLENALLDFAVRDGDLVLERVNPLFPARGRGKPIVAWSLSPMDHELARRDLVRLAVLPEARLWNDKGASNDGGEAPSSPPSVALRRLGLREIAIRLALAPIEPARGRVRLRSIGSLSVRGAVHHVAGRGGGAQPGELVAELEALTASVVGVPVGKSRLDVRSVVLDAAKPVVLPFADVSPTGVRLALSGLALHGVVFA